MSVSTRYFRADADGVLARVSAAQMQRWWRGEPLPPSLAASGELKYLEVYVETESRQVTRVLRIGPHRHVVGKQGKIDRNVAMVRAVDRMDLLQRHPESRSAADEIKLLEADANAFWSPTDAHLAMVGTWLFGERLAAANLADLRSKVFRPPDSIYGAGDDGDTRESSS